MNKVNDLSCLLCGSKQLSTGDCLTAEEILKLWSRVGHQFSSTSIQQLLDEKIIGLYCCNECSFQFFNPKLAGAADFYEQLEAQNIGYYAPERAENKRNAQFAVQKGFRNILDIGCGSGFALDAAKRAGLRTYGIELSRTAAASAAARGHTIFQVLLEDMDVAWNGKFDFISMNQLLEHVPDPAGLLRHCIRLLSPKGVIAIAVPGASGILRLTPFEPTNWPPHHISRWRKKDFYNLAKIVGLKVLMTGGDPLYGREIEKILLAHRENCLVLGKPYHGPSPLLIKALSFFYRKTGMKFIFRSQGHSIFCYLGCSSK